MSRNRSTIARSLSLGLAGLILLATSLLAVPIPQPPVWDTASNPLGAGPYHQPEYPLAFVAVAIREDDDGTVIDGNYHHGTDVLSANNPDAENHLWVLTPNGDVKKLFPLPEHELINGLIDTPTGDLYKGSVMEPNVSEDGLRLYFSYVHDATDETFIGSGTAKLPWSGADLYAIDLTPLVNDPDFPPGSLVPTRLTTRHDVEKFAMNPDAAMDTVAIRWAPTYMHAVEMRTADGLKLVYSSDERSLQNSNRNFSLGEANHNFNLHMADIVETADGPALENRKQLQYYTTTSAMSPAPLREGVAFSYQASTTEARQWHIQRTDSVGRWNTLLGYGANQELVHLGSLCVSNTGGVDLTPHWDNPGGSATTYAAGDYFIAARYYNQNNEGFGTLHRISLDPSTLGLNRYDRQIFSHGARPEQVGNKVITRDSTSNDDPSGKVGDDFFGKFTSPRCGKPDELYAGYTPTSANGRVVFEGRRDHYRSYIAYRDSLAEFAPITDQKIVVRDGAGLYSLVWPTPIISWLERTGSDAQQQYQNTIVDPNTPILAGVPHAQIGTAQLYNTDRKPFDCWLGSGGANYNPSVHHYGNSVIQVVKNQDGLTQVQPGGWCANLELDNVLGIAINITSNKVQGDFAVTNDPNVPGYETGGWFGGNKANYFGGLEATKLLGVYDVRDQMNGADLDASFKALIPARVPFELHLLDRTYGLKLTDVRSWHSLQPRETRTDCGGCHQHDVNATVTPPAFNTTYAASQPATDFVNETPRLQYNANCSPEIVSTPGEATHPITEWSDLWTEFDASCSRCHDSTLPPDPQSGLGEFAYADMESAYRELNANFYANPVAGALGSPAFWAARGERTDGRDNSVYSGTTPSFFFSPEHVAAPEIQSLCGGSDPRGAAWVYDFGQWIDNHMPRDNPDPKHEYSYERDWYHPAVDFAIKNNNCVPRKIRIGHWDDSGGLASLEVLIDEMPEKLYLEPTDDLSNAKGKRVHTFTTPGMNSSSSVKVIATDDAGNRQFYSKSLGQLEDECVPVDILPHDDPLPFP